MNDSQLYQELARIYEHPLYMGYFTMTTLSRLISEGWAEFYTRDLVKITGPGVGILNQLNLRELFFPGSVMPRKKG